MESRISLLSSHGTLEHLVIDADEQASLESVTQAVATHLRVAGPGRASGQEEVAWRSSGLQEGAAYTFAPAQEPAFIEQKLGVEVAEGSYFLKQVSGPRAGRIFNLLPGHLTLGADAACTVVLEGEELPPTLAHIEVDAEGHFTVENTSEHFPIYLDGEPLTQPTSWEEGSVLRVDNYLFEMSREQVPQASLTPADSLGFWDYNRPPRLMPGARQNEFRYPMPPEPTSRGSLPLLAMLVPLILACTMAMLLKQPYFLVFGIMSPVMMLVNTMNNRKTGKQTFREKKAKHRQTIATIDQDLKEAVVAFASERRMLSPDPATVGMIANLPTPRLWERRRQDPDHLSVRVGVHHKESDVKLVDPQEIDHRKNKYPTAPDIPATLSLAEYGVIGLYGEDDAVHRSACWLVAQLAVLQSPRDISLTILTEMNREKEWEWTRWLPHTAHSRGAFASIGNDARTVGQRLNEAVRVIEQRQEQESAEPQLFDALVVVFDGARKLRQWPGAAKVLAEGPSVGVYSICLDSEERLLPEESRAVVCASGREWTVRRDRNTSLVGVTPDLPDWEWFEWVARGIAALKDSSDEDESSIPTSSRFLSVERMEDPTPEQVLARWGAAARTTQVMVGESFDGAFSVDIRKDGPHALIAGTTGSGKSELLQTVIASLALNNHPNELNFVLIDYKGGAAFKDFVDLPHTVGNVTDLDGHLVERAMQSLGAELHRRERLLATVGAKDIEDFTDARERGETDALMPRLLLVIDEFAALKAELPEFVSGIVNIAQRGRSLGIHLVMATQRPQGAITADILANTNLRIALRMADPAESRDVIGTVDAAEISTSTPGRAYVRSGSSPLLPFQSSRIGGPRPGSVAVAVAAPRVLSVPWRMVGHALPVAAVQKTENTAVTDLQVLVESMVGASEQAQIVRQPSPWLPALSAQLVLANCQLEAQDPERTVALIPFGLQDFPEDQQQRPMVLDFETLTHLFIVGSPRSGRTQALRTIAGSIAQHTLSNDVHLYGIDFGNGGLNVLGQLPQCGTVIARTQLGLLERFINQLEKEVAHRRNLLGAAGYSSLAEQRKNSPVAERLPHLVVLFDQWEGYIHADSETAQSPLTASIMNLLREGASVGLHFIMAGDRSLLSSRIAPLVEQKLLMRLTERTDYSSASINPRELPEKIGEGRVFASSTAREGQIALLAQDPSTQAQVAELMRLAQESRQRHEQAVIYREPVVYKDLPMSFTLEDLRAYGAASHPQRPWLGIGGEDVQPLALDLAEISTFVVGGPTRSGKSTVLSALARSVLDAGGRVALVTPSRSPLRDMAGEEGVLLSLEGSAITASAVQELLALEDVLVLIDDASAISDVLVVEALKGIGAALSREGFSAVIADGLEELDRVGPLSWMNIFVKNKHGAILAPVNIFSGRCVGLTLTQQLVSQPRPVGRALVNCGNGVVTQVQVAKV